MYSIRCECGTVSFGLGGHYIKIKVKGHCQHNWIYQLEKLTMTEHKLWSSYPAKSHQYPSQEIYTQEPYHQGHNRD